MSYKFVRYADMQKEMGVNGRAIHILGDRNFIVPNVTKDEKGLEFMIEMKLNGEKVMSTFFRSI